MGSQYEEEEEGSGGVVIRWHNFEYRDIKHRQLLVTDVDPPRSLLLLLPTLYLLLLLLRLI